MYSHLNLPSIYGCHGTITVIGWDRIKEDKRREKRIRKESRGEDKRGDKKRREEEKRGEKRIRDLEERRG